jgi:hypothetical protein
MHCQTKDDQSTTSLKIQDLEQNKKEMEKKSKKAKENGGCAELDAGLAMSAPASLDTRSESEMVVASEMIVASVLGADGATIELGPLQRSMTIHCVKEAVAKRSSMAVSSQTLYVLDDNRQGVDDLALKNHETLQDIIKYRTEPSDELQLAVMLGLEPLNWEHYDKERVKISDDTMEATKLAGGFSLVTTGRELTAGRHYMEVQVSGPQASHNVGLVRPGLDLGATYFASSCRDAWLMNGCTGKW